MGPVAEMLKFFLPQNLRIFPANIFFKLSQAFYWLIPHTRCQLIKIAISLDFNVSNFKLNVCKILRSFFISWGKESIFQCNFFVTFSLELIKEAMDLEQGKIEN